MSDLAIQVKGLSKRYRIGMREEYPTIRETLMRAALAPLSAARSWASARNNGTDPGWVWALRDVDLEVKQGEVVGIIGRNGAGKSTLLKVLSGITEPTAGYADIYGRVGSLLEVGTGFHMELTGRENIFMNGALLGMSRHEIKCKFDEIVAFAEVEAFLDTPVKRYSSGMYMRLAFAVAAHLDPEILMVDEVLAVGDAAFQKKCLGKMGDVAKEGRTVLFVSHNMVAIESLCNRALLFKEGQLSLEGDARELVNHYLTLHVDGSCGRRDLLSHPGRTKASIPIMTQVTLASDAEAPISSVRMGSSLSVEVEFFSSLKPIQPVLGIVIKNQHGSPIFGLNNRFISGYSFNKPLSNGTITCYIDRLPLMPGRYVLDLYFGDQHDDLDVVYEAISFEVTPADVFGTGQLPPSSAGPIFWPAIWSLRNG